jgi:hypothetical protein
LFQLTRLFSCTRKIGFAIWDFAITPDLKLEMKPLFCSCRKFLNIDATQFAAKPENKKIQLLDDF